ncbi:hypothetical protein NPIL_151431, partial [Nephila pilipes]
MGDIPLFKLPASEKELDKIVLKFSAPNPSHETKTAPIAAPSPQSGQTTVCPPEEKDSAKDRDSEGFISPPKHLTRKAPKANPLSQIKDIPTIDSNPDVDVNTL